MCTSKKIAFIVSTLSSGGAERVISNLSNVLIENFEIVIITFIKSEPFYNLDNRIKVISCKDEIRQSKSIFQSIRLNYILTKRIYRILKKEQVHLAIGFITSANILTTIASKIQGIPCVISERNNPLVEDVPRLWKILRSIIYPLTDTLVVQTEGVKKIYGKSIKSDKLIILPNPISSNLSILRDETVIKENIILTVGRLDENKGHEIIIKAFSFINPENWKLLIIGDGEKKQELIALINSLNLSSKIKILSKVKQIENYYNISSIFVFASKSEGFPNALLEAMHFGLPCISFDCNFGPSDLIDDGINGYLIPINQELVFRERLTQLINSKELRLNFSQESKTSTEMYKSDVAVDQWKELINSFVSIQKD